MVQLENIEAIEARLWRAADLLRSVSELASHEYSMFVMGVIFLQQAYSRFLGVKPRIIPGLPSRSGVTRAFQHVFHAHPVITSPIYATAASAR